MAIFCHASRRIQADAKTHGIPVAKLQDFAREVEKRQSLAGFDQFPTPCLTKKKIFGYNYRLIAVEKHVGDHLVLVLLRLVVRSSGEYDSFLADPATWAQRFYEEELDEARLADWLNGRTESERPSPPPELSETEQAFLWATTYSDHGEDPIICETNEWVEAVREPRIADRLIRLPELIVQATEGPAGEVQILRSPGDKHLAIVAFNVPDTRQCVLISVSYSESDDALRARGEECAGRLAAAGAETVLRYSRRSYPSLLCYDDDMWMVVEKDPQANLALSPEEAEILRASGLHDPARPAFPLFINGRAGSGKSTLLQYLFAQCLLRWANQPRWRSEHDSRPLYIASSRELLKVAEDVVRDLLKANHEHLLATQHVEAPQPTDIGPCFQDFLSFMRSAMGEEADRRYPLSAYVGYAKFRRLWAGRFGREQRAIHDYGPQVSWHVIRGLIKGMSVDGLLSKEDYDELPQDERTISRRVYEAVYDRVWTAWYEPLCRGGEAWDSQDLVRCLIEEDRLPASHAAVFCDEAQDFTRLELESLYRSSLFSDRQIDGLSVRRVPFVFAGDPFQTLNPTGFRWESVRAAFTERILRSLYRFNPRIEAPQLNYRELTFNYRSATRVVHLCNSIQAVRASLFGHRSLRPQSTWQLGNESSAPVFFEKGNPQMEAALRDQSDIVLIVPCEEGEEVEYVENDAYLKTVVQLDDDGIPRNVLSAARAKGLEFLRVALYGWSSREEAVTLAKMLRSPGQGDVSVDRRLGLEYFLNNLYVAASRAQRRLFVIDDKRSRDELWWFATDEQHLSEILQSLPQRDVWADHTGSLVWGVPESFREDRDDPRALADRYERDGRSNEDSYFLKQASQQYAIAGEATKAHECRAFASMLEGRYREAGESYEKAGQVGKAIDAYWCGRHYKEIENCVSAYPDFARQARCRIAVFLRGASRTARECHSLLSQILENAKQNDSLRSELRSHLWKEALQQAVKMPSEVKGRAKGAGEGDDVGAMADLMVQLRAIGTELEARQIALLYSAAGRHEDVLRWYGSDDGSDTYRDAQALALIGRMGSDEQAYGVAESRVIADYYFRQEDYQEASRFYGDARDSDRLLECLRLSLAARESQVPVAILRAAVSVLIANAEWESLISLLTTGQPRMGKHQKWDKPTCKSVLEIAARERLVVRLVVPALARSVELSVAPAKSQQPISEFLANHLIKSGYPAWRNDLDREVAGAAIERAGRDIDALQFYESWRDSAASPEDREYAERRWVVCKLRQASRQEREGSERRASSNRAEAEKVMARRGWNEADVPDTYPELARRSRPDPDATAHPLTTLDAVASKGATQAGEDRGRLGPLTYRVIAPKGWINIESEAGLCARVLVRERKVTSVDVTLDEIEGGGIRCPEWGLEVGWLDGAVVEFRLGHDTRRVSVGNRITNQ